MMQRLPIWLIELYYYRIQRGVKYASEKSSITDFNYMRMFNYIFDI